MTSEHRAASAFLTHGFVEELDDDSRALSRQVELNDMRFEIDFAEMISISSLAMLRMAYIAHLSGGC